MSESRGGSALIDIDPILPEDGGGVCIPVRALASGPWLPSTNEQSAGYQNSMVPITRFTELLADIEPSPTTKSNASSGHQGIRHHLQYHDTFKERFSERSCRGVTPATRQFAPPQRVTAGNVRMSTSSW